MSKLEGPARRKFEDILDLHPHSKLVGMLYAVAYFCDYKSFLGTDLSNWYRFKGRGNHQAHPAFGGIDNAPLDLDD